MESITQRAAARVSTPPDPSNAQQAEAWDGGEGAYWAAHHRSFEACLKRYEPAFIEAAAIKPDNDVIDVGCGTGVSARAAAVLAPSGSVLGIDLSSQMIEVARRLASETGLGNLTFIQGDAQVHPFAPASADVIVSRTGAMFFGDPHAAFSNLRRSLRPDGRLVLLTWQRADQQEWIAEFSRALTGSTPPTPDIDVPGPFALCDVDRVRSLLEGAGFADVVVMPRREPMTYGPSVDRAHELLVGLLGWMLEGQGAARRAESLAALQRTLEAHQTPTGIHFGSAAWIITARPS